MPDQTAPNEPSLPAPAPPPPDGPSEEELKRAMSAFRKRLKLTRLDQESRLGGGRPVTSGRKSDILGIVPPSDFPREVWKTLAARKLLKDMGGGFYTLP